MQDCLGGVIDQLRNPEGLDAGEWLELNQVLGEASISGACGKLTAQPDGEDRRAVAASQPDGGASDGSSGRLQECGAARGTDTDTQRGALGPRSRRRTITGGGAVSGP